MRRYQRPHARSPRAIDKSYRFVELPLSADLDAFIDQLPGSMTTVGLDLRLAVEAPHRLLRRAGGHPLTRAELVRAHAHHRSEFVNLGPEAPRSSSAAPASRSPEHHASGSAAWSDIGGSITMPSPRNRRDAAVACPRSSLS